MFDPISIAIQLALAAALFTAQYALSSRDKTARREPEKTVVQAAVRPRTRSFGKVCRTDGLEYFFAARDAVACMGVVYDHGPIDRYERFAFGDEGAPVDANNQIDGGRYAGWGTIHPRPTLESEPGYTRSGGSGHGFADQPALGLIPAYFPDIFGSATHVVKGASHVQIGFTRPRDEKEVARVFREGFPRNLRSTYYAIRAWDPRDPAQSAEADDADKEWYSGTWKWLDNAPLIILDTIRCPRAHGGWGKPLSRIHVPSFVDAATIADGPISRGPNRGTERRYRAWGTYGFDEPIKGVLGRMLATCDGDLHLTADGKIALRLGEFGTPAATFTKAEMGNVRLSRGAGLLAAVNHVVPKFTDPAKEFQEADAPEVRDEASIALLGRELSETLDLPYVPSPTQAYRLAHRWMKRQNPRRRISFSAGPAGLKAAGEAFIGIDRPDLGIANGTFQVLDMQVAGNLREVQIEAVEVTADTFAEPYPDRDPDYDPGDPNPTAIPSVSGPALAIGEETGPAGSVLFLEASASPPTDQSLHLEGEYRKRSEAAWAPLGRLDAFLLRSAPASDDTTYVARLRYVDPVGRAGPWTVPALQIKVTAPAYEAEADALLARMGPTTATRKRHVNALIKRLKAAGVWTKLDALYLCAAPSAADARLNWVQNAFNLTQSGSVAFHVDRGFTGDGTNGHHSTGFNPTTATTPKFLRDSAHMGVWVLAGPDQAAYDLGSTSSAINVRTATGSLATAGNGAAQTAAVAEGVGFSLWSRPDANGYARYKDGQAIAPVPQASAALTNLPFLVGARNGGTPTYSTRQIAAAAFGGALTAAEASALHAALRDFLTAIDAT